MNKHQSWIKGIIWKQEKQRQLWAAMNDKVNVVPKSMPKIYSHKCGIGLFLTLMDHTFSYGFLENYPGVSLTTSNVIPSKYEVVFFSSSLN